jgi:hypothetical protein
MVARNGPGKKKELVIYVTAGRGGRVMGSGSRLALRETCHLGEEFARVDRFGEEGENMPIKLSCVDEGGSGGLAGKKEHFTSGALLAQLNGEVKAIHSDHDDIADEQVGRS